MTQRGAVFLGPTVIQFELPPANEEVLVGVPWGSIDAFPTPAYWVYQVLARRVNGTSIRYRLGETLIEEVGACLLGGHGIHSSVGLAAYRQLKTAGVFQSVPTEDKILDILSNPICINGKQVHYRFARQKSRYLHFALSQLATEVPPSGTGRELRDWLIKIPGIGFKTASWIARNWLDANDIAILDIHVLRAGMMAGFLEAGLTVERNYLDLERQFLNFSQAIGVRASELDAVIWFEMMSASTTIRTISKKRHISNGENIPQSWDTAYKSSSNSKQLSLFN
ncbi:MAG: 8-oxoguanine DNA glycosylase [Leptospirillum sp.]